MLIFREKDQGTASKLLQFSYKGRIVSTFCVSLQIMNRNLSPDLLYQIAITQIPMVGAVIAKQLISYCGGVKEVFEARKKDLLKIPGIGSATVDCILKQDVLERAEKEIDFIIKNEIQPLFYLDKNYPQRLIHHDDSPVLLFYKGNTNLNTARVIGIVGTRKPTERGRLMCEEIVSDLKKYDVMIASGLAYGIDVTAHRKCLSENVPTVGVLGHGLDRIYPAAHQKTAFQMTENGGLLSEYISKTEPSREHFPMRNRIIAGMCDALIVVETARRGGSMISAEVANSYNKDVFAIPGRVKDPYSEGCNHLIKAHKAYLMESVEDLIYHLRWDVVEKSEAVQRQFFVDLSEPEQKVVTILQATEQIGIDKLSYESSMPSSELLSVLLGLEFKGMVKSLPGKRYMLV